jgi:hypothetical protein
VVGELPEWAGSLTVPEVYAKSIAHYGLQVKAFLDGLGPDASRTDGSGMAATPGAGGYPGAGEALAAHRLVDQAYRSAAAGGVPIPSL